MTSSEDERLHKFYDFWAEFLGEHRPAADHICNTDESGGTIQGAQGQRVYAKRGQPVVPQMRSTSRENCTIVTTVNAAGAVLAPTIIFKGQCFNGDWIVDQDGPPGATYTCTESPFMCGDVFIKSLNIHLVQLPSHMSHITQPLDVAGFGCFKKELTKAIQAFPATHGGALPRKRDMASVIGQAWSTSFTPDINKASFAGAGLWPVDKERALSRLLKPKRKERETDRPPLQDVPIAVSNDRLEELLGERAVRKLLGEGHTLTGLRVSTVFLGDYLPSKRSKKPPTRANLGIPEGGLLTCDGWLAEMKKKQNEAEAAEAAKAAKAAARQTARDAKAAAAAAAAARNGGRGRGQGRGRGWGQRRGRGGGREEESRRDERTERGREEGGGRGVGVVQGGRGGRGRGARVGGRTVGGRGEGTGGHGRGGGPSRGGRGAEGAGGAGGAGGSGITGGQPPAASVSRSGRTRTPTPVVDV
ncbi:unnamed protein product [Ectocarpus sp. CCAP 1310/34]|nr:unnamed protein product [Ectocarpus sp. CCAP 1310/34]